MSNFDLLFDKAKLEVLKTPKTAFLRTILFTLKHEITETIPTLAVTSTTLYVNPKFFASYSKDLHITFLMHEALHVALYHCCKSRMKRMTNQNVLAVAVDIVVNNILKQDGYAMHTFPFILDPAMEDMGLERVYELLMSTYVEQTKQVRIKGNNFPVAGDEDLANDPMFASMENQEEDDNTPTQTIDKLIVRANTIQRMEGTKVFSKTNNPDYRNVIDAILSPKIPWDRLLSKWMNELAKTDYSTERFDQQYLQHNLYAPTLSNKTTGDFCCIFDVSGSIDDDTLAKIHGTILYTKKRLKPKKVPLITFSGQINTETKFTNRTDLKEVAKKTDYSTDIRPVANWLKKHKPKFCVIFTDGYFRYVDDMGIPFSNIIWVIYNNEEFGMKGRVIHYDNFTR